MLLSLVAVAALSASAPDTIAAPIVAAENGFAADAPRIGVRRAFLSHFDAGSWLFRPYPVAAHDALARDPDDGAPLEWGPEIVGVAASGDMGFTSGPWTARAPGVGDAGYGHFVSVWKRGADGVWRVQVDGGYAHPRLKAPVGVKTVMGPEKLEAPLAADALAARKKALEAADDSLRGALAKGDAADVRKKLADPEWRAMRANEMPLQHDDAFALAAKDAAKLGSGTRRASDISSTGDLAWTIGGDASCKECGSYYRIWRWHDGGWRLLVDLVTP